MLLLSRNGNMSSSSGTVLHCNYYIKLTALLSVYQKWENKLLIPAVVNSLQSNVECFSNVLHARWNTVMLIRVSFMNENKFYLSQYILVTFHFLFLIYTNFTLPEPDCKCVAFSNLDHTITNMLLETVCMSVT